MSIDFRSLANNYIRHLPIYQPGKPIEELERELGIHSSIKLASNENPLGPSPLAVKAATQALSSVHIYPDGPCFELKQLLAKIFSIQPEQLTIGNGSENILELIMKAYLPRNGTAIISEFAFLTIPLLINSFNVNLKVIPAKNWGHDINAMLNAVDEQTNAIFLVNPNNPTGTYFTDKEFYRVMERVPTKVLVVVDEAYFEYIAHHDYPNTLSLLSDYPNLIITRTFSKAYGLAGLRIGYAIASVEIAEILNRARLPFNVNAVAVKAACSALLDQEHIKKSLLVNQQGMKQIEEALKTLQLNYIPSLANFISIDVGDAMPIYQKLLLDGVIVRPLNAYNMRGHIRVTIGTKEQNERFIDSLKKIHHLIPASVVNKIKIEI